MARRSVEPTTPPSTPQLVQPAGASLDELRREWRRLYYNDPPRISRDLLILGIGYRLQELEHGGLGKATRRKLRTLAKTLRATGRVGPTPSLSLKPGARLVREWHGRTHTVTVSEDGFEYAGTSYPSLTKIAKKITGAHWSGPRFFGLPAAGKRTRAESAMTESEKKTMRPVKRSRCAIYTRKSTDEGLEQAFNSLDAQREACAAFIQSQRHEGWTVLPTLYDDGGFSGGSMERPGLQRLQADIEAGQIDVVVVYKVDRLTRALSDFAKLVEVFDRRCVSFVSITQQFNTTTSMGRLTLNILLSFAQFERELIGERVRDKIAASKKKGMWMGGTVPLGYDAKDRKLVVNDDEARTVVDIFQRYLKLRSVRALGEELAAAGIRSKLRVRPDGTEHGHQRFSHGALYLMLQNRTYRGEATHKGNSYPGEHSAIVDKPLWDAVQSVLADNRVARSTGARAKQPSLLTGMAFDEAGERLTPTWSVKKGTRYRYYVSTSLVTGAARSHSNRRRIPAGNLEAGVINRLRTLLANRGELLDAIHNEADENPGQKPLIERGHQIADELNQCG
jgi:site-specific DNA recombinase